MLEPNITVRCGQMSRWTPVVPSRVDSRVDGVESCPGGSVVGTLESGTDKVLPYGSPIPDREPANAADIGSQVLTEVVSDITSCSG